MGSFLNKTYTKMDGNESADIRVCESADILLSSHNTEEMQGW